MTVSVNLNTKKLAVLDRQFFIIKLCDYTGLVIRNTGAGKYTGAAAITDNVSSIFDFD